MIYKPDLDSFFILKIMEEKYKDKDIYLNRCVDLGSGTGILSSFLEKICEHIVAIDIFREACRITSQTLSLGDVVMGSGLSSFREGAVDLIVSNPPYLPCEDDISICGGPEGVDIALSFAREALYVLKSSGKFLLLLSSLGNLEKFFEEVVNMGFSYTIVSTKYVGFFETLYAIELKKPP